MDLDSPSPSIGPFTAFRIPWSTFVKSAISVTIRGYYNMRRARVAKKEWMEDTFTATLGEDFIASVACEVGLGVIVRSKVHTPEIKAGDVTPRKAKEIDMWLFGTWDLKNIRTERFVWECKLIDDRAVSEESSNLTSEYISQGIFRFIDEEYSKEVDDAGMIGYVLNGNVLNIASNVNQSMIERQRHRKLSESEFLVSADCVDEFEFIYLSRHIRSTSRKPINLHHLFLTFDF